MQDPVDVSTLTGAQWFEAELLASAGRAVVAVTLDRTIEDVEIERRDGTTASAPITRHPCSTGITVLSRSSGL